MSDLIERQKAIDTVKNMRECCDTNDINDYYDLLHEAFNVLPSAQPAPCEFCKHNNIADDKACLMCSAERRTDEQTD